MMPRSGFDDTGSTLEGAFQIANDVAVALPPPWDGVAGIVSTFGDLFNFFFPSPSYPALLRPDPESELFKWFVTNDKRERKPLPALKPGEGLPALERYKP